MANNPKLLLLNPHTHMAPEGLQLCVDYELTEAVEGITSGMVGTQPDPTHTNADTLEVLKHLAVEDINSRQTTCTFLLDDVITWACSL